LFRTCRYAISVPTDLDVCVCGCNNNPVTPGLLVRGILAINDGLSHLGDCSKTTVVLHLLPHSGGRQLLARDDGGTELLLSARWHSSRLLHSRRFAPAVSGCPTTVSVPRRDAFVALDSG
jgi:hypothetical protein